MKNRMLFVLYGRPSDDSKYLLISKINEELVLMSGQMTQSHI